MVLLPDCRLGDEEILGRGFAAERGVLWTKTHSSTRETIREINSSDAGTDTGQEQEVQEP